MIKSLRIKMLERKVKTLEKKCMALKVAFEKETNRANHAAFHCEQVLKNIPQIYKDKDAILAMIARLVQWAKNAETDRTASAKAEQDARGLIKVFQAATNPTRRR